MANNSIRGIRKEYMEDILEYLSEKLNDFNYKKVIVPTIFLLVYVAGFTYLYSLIGNVDYEAMKKIISSIRDFE